MPIIKGVVHGTIFSFPYFGSVEQLVAPLTVNQPSLTLGVRIPPLPQNLPQAVKPCDGR